MSVPVLQSSKPSNSSIPFLSPQNSAETVLHQRLPLPPEAYKRKRAGESRARQALQEQVNPYAESHARSAQKPPSARITVTGKENQRPSQASKPVKKASPLLRRAVLNQMNKPIARYVLSTDIGSFLQALRDNPKAELVETRPGSFALVRPDQVPSRQRTSPVKLLMDLMTMMRNNQWPFAGRDRTRWDRFFALAYLVEFERACSREPGQRVPMLVEAIEHIMDGSKEQLKCVERKFRPLN
jgi:hypothetical protein